MPGTAGIGAKGANANNARSSAFVTGGRIPANVARPGQATSALQPSHPQFTVARNNDFTISMSADPNAANFGSS